MEHHPERPARPRRGLAGGARPRSAPRDPARGHAGRQAFSSGGSILAASGSPDTPSPSIRRTRRDRPRNTRGSSCGARSGTRHGTCPTGCLARPGALQRPFERRAPRDARAADRAAPTARRPTALRPSTRPAAGPPPCGRPRRQATRTPPRPGKCFDKLNTETAPKLPIGRPPTSVSSAWAASSISGMPRRAHARWQLDDAIGQAVRVARQHRVDARPDVASRHGLAAHVPVLRRHRRHHRPQSRGQGAEEHRVVLERRHEDAIAGRQQQPEREVDAESAGRREDDIRGRCGPRARLRSRARGGAPPQAGLLSLPAPGMTTRSVGDRASRRLVSPRHAPPAADARDAPAARGTVPPPARRHPGPVIACAHPDRL